jgi:hypothetical protein
MEFRGSRDFLYFFGVHHSAEYNGGEKTTRNSVRNTGTLWNHGEMEAWSHGDTEI